MPRQLRVWYPGAIYHIVARGNRRAAIFIDKQDYLEYLRILEDVRSMYPFLLHSYCLMTNHIHLQLETTLYHIQYIMKELHSRYAVYLNIRLKIEGHVFQGRYGARLIETSDYFLEVSRYIHRNPFEAKMVRKLEDYKWSSYSSYVTPHINPHVYKDKTLSYFNEPFHQEYRKFIERKNTNTEEQPCILK
ncbi:MULTISPECIES: transposase [unclassified Bacillus (in: firmicutes)]|uniref:transposase n=1 Tax=unclassified Bacillus (in: firmicutes) TaxID=185979 RepID=UPI0008E80BA0|nr:MULTISPECIES: transposase [unclassified Bacillus (in: firmicutes)]SFB19547.1 REP element-mobilizing transposase RayT [Bacillus sp. UNCCL13]SFQ90689.1 REP element-mobilizing transposase RayT [Bacillus sp. cl95]